jgi:hypothetical protein
VTNLLCSLSLLFLFACTSNPARKALNIQPGMTKEEVLGIAGQPSDRTFVGNSERWTFDSEEGPKKVVLFRSGKVVTLESAAAATATPEKPTAELPQTSLPCAEKNTFGSFAEGGGCNMYGCYPPGGYCNSFGCSTQGNCTNKKCPKRIDSYVCVE